MEVLFLKSALIISTGLLMLSLAGCTVSGAVQSPDIGAVESNNEIAAETSAALTEKSDANEVTAISEKTAIPSDKPSEDKLIELVSEYLSSSNAIESIEMIKACLKQLEGFPDVTGKNPFFWYAKGLVSQYEGDLKAAAGFMGKAAAIAPNNRDIVLWQKAFDRKEGTSTGRSIKLGSGESGLEGESFNFYDGTMWVDEHSLLVTVEKGSGSEAVQYLMHMDVDTLQSRQVYKGSYIGLDSVTPDGRYAVLYDKGLRLVSIETGESVTINEKGLYAALSPDGRKLAYCADGLWVYEIETGENTRLDDGRDDASPIWFPDGKGLLFIGDLGGKELGGGAGHLQGIFRMPSDPAGKKERIDESWEGRFHYIKWILAGEIFHAEEGWDDGFNSVAYYLYTGFRNQLGSMSDGEYLAYRHDNAGYLYISDGRGGISLMDLEGKVLSRFEYGNIWGSAFANPIKGIEALQGSDGLLMYYHTPLEDVMHVYNMDAELGSTSIMADIPVDSPLKALVDRKASRAVFAVSANELLIVELKQPISSLQQTHS